MSASASAPGKLILAGEYAVLRGAPAIVAAIDRRAVAAEVPDPEPLSPFLAEVAAVLGREPGRLRVDTSSFAIDGRKLGLGSSAAATVAFAGALAPDLDREAIHGVAHRAHGDVSERAGARGSGIDIAAAIYGGVLVATPRAGDLPPAVEPISFPASVTFVAVDVGAPADTRTLVSAVMAATTDAALEPIAAAARALAGATDPAEAITAIAAGMQAISDLGRSTGVALVTPQIERIATLASARGGAAKPTGAGGGDVAIAAFSSEAAAGQFRDDLASAGISHLSLAFDPYGLLQTTGPDGMVPGC